MAADYARMVAELQAFYDFTGKSVILVGAGAGKFIDACRGAKHLVAVDQDAEVLGQFERALRVRGMQGKASVICAEFLEVAARGDVVYFEFCFHEMADPLAALRHACDLAPEVLVFDHLPGSPWTYYTNEEDKVRRSTSVITSGGVQRRETHQGAQRFRNHAELQAMLAQGEPVCLERIEAFREESEIVIPMSYGLALLRGPGAG
ncbi:MAG: class I SAM-dependent methyltransferase [Acidobacteria bacterium]|nr:class I SAM-dependent methyltransferase [Acidobacteriota bacterium]